MPGWGSIHNNTVYSMGLQLNRLAEIQEKIATGADVVRASDSPSSAFRILTLRSEETSYDSYADNLSTVQYNLNQISETFSDLTSLVAQAEARLTQAASGTYSSANRKAIGEEYDVMIERALTLLNTKFMGRYLFGGDDTVNKPFEAVRQDGRISAVTYKGSYENMEVPIAPGGLKQDSTVVGDEVLRAGETPSVSLLSEGSTLAAGRTTPTVTGSAWLEVSKDSTTYPGPNRGLAAGGSSQTHDTVVGTQNLTISTVGPDNFIQLEGGTQVQFDGTETDLKVTGPDDQVVYVDVSGWDGTAGGVTVEADGYLSIDGGVTKQLINFSDNQEVVSSLTGKSLYIDTTSAKKIGNVPVHIDGTYGLFEQMIHIRDLLLNKGGHADDVQRDMLSAEIDSLGHVLDTITQQLSSAGGKIQAMGSMQDQMEDLSYNSQTQRSALQDADVPALSADLAQSMTYYEMTLAASSKLLSVSLLDYIR